MSAEQKVIELLEVVRQKDEALATKDGVIALAHQEIKLLKEKIDVLIRRVFGTSSEKLDAAQLELLLNLPRKDDELGKASGCAAVAPLAQPEQAKPRKERKPRIPEHLPVIEEQIVPEPVKANPELWRQIGEERSERLDFEPAKFLRRVTVRPKYVRRHDPDAVPIVAVLPPSLQERCLAAPGLLAQVIVSKFCDHLPFYRQEQIYRTRHGVDISRQVMCGWAGLVADWSRPIYEKICAGVMLGGYVQIDETPIRYLDPGNPAHKTRQGYLWVGSKPKGDVCFRWETSREAECLDRMLPPGFRGIVQCDGYSGYRCFAKDREIILAGCWAHVRRRFREAADHTPQAAWVILQIRHLYEIEAELRRIKAGPRLRDAVRAHQSRPILERLRKMFLCWKTKHRFLPQSLMGKAIDYALGQWSPLEVYLREGRVEIDNNLVENAIRPTALGKKNWLFVGDALSGERTAILYTIVECCRRRGIDPYAYLRDILTRLPRMTNWELEKADLTPAGWAKEQRELAEQARQVASAA